MKTEKQTYKFRKGDIVQHDRVSRWEDGCNKWWEYTGIYEGSCYYVVEITKNVTITVEIAIEEPDVQGQLHAPDDLTLVVG